jgi:serine/threonine protein kinase
LSLQHDDIKIFDFGLARVLDSNERQADGTYKMTKMTGSLRFMASEVLKGDRYNEKADVYSFTLVLWEMLALEQPYKRVFRKSQTDQAQQHMKRVCCDGQRPPLKHFWSAAIREIFKHGWAGSVHERYGIEKIQNMLRTEILHLRNGDMSGISDLVCISA